MYTKLLKTIDYGFQNLGYLETALTHSSYIHEHKNNGQDSNERLEFLGDAVLELVISDHLFRTYTHMPEGELTKFRASIVCASSLAKNANAISLGQYVKLGKGEEQTGGRSRESLLADTFEALIGAIHLDGGYDCAKDFILRQMSGSIDASENQFAYSDCKTYLQELIQKTSKDPLVYRIVEEKGPEHNKVFVAEVLHQNQVLGTGEGKSKKEAEQEAARQSLSFFKQQDN